MARIRPARPEDAAALNRALSDLSHHMGDTHRARAADLHQALFGPVPVSRAAIADGADGPVGAILYSPLFSTVRGGAGLFVSDLWVAAEARRNGLGVALLGHAAAEARVAWGARFLRLVVYDDNPQARAFYAARGFEEARGEIGLVLSGAAFDDLKETV